MQRNIFPLLFCVLLMPAGVMTAHAQCTAAHPSASVAESTPSIDFSVTTPVVGESVVTHAKTGLIWKQCSEGQSGAGCATGTGSQMTWQNALKTAIAANTANFAGYNDWRLPNLKELASIVEYCGYTPAINQSQFPLIPYTAPASYFWSASSSVLDPSQAWFVDFADGHAGGAFKSVSNYVRLVRGGTSSAAFDVLALPPNVAPVAGSVSIAGAAQVGQILTGSYVYADADGDLQDISATGATYRFVQSVDNSVFTAIDNANVASGVTGGSDQMYTIQAADLGKYLFYCVVPRAITGNTPGVESCSVATLAVTVAPALKLLSVVSRKVHGGTPFSLIIDHTQQSLSGNITVEPRAIGTGHTLIFHFDNPVTSAGAATVLDALSAAAGQAAVTLSSGDVVVVLTNVPANKRLTVTLNGLNGSGTATASMGFLVGDVNNSRAVDPADISAVKLRSGQITDATNFKFDVNTSGVIGAADILAVKARLGQALAP